MTRFTPVVLVTGLVFAAGFVASAQSPSSMPSRPDYDVDFIGQPLPDPVMQHAKETYVLYGCAYCHGVTLIARGEAADLMHSALVGADEDGNVIVPLLKAGIPQTAKLSPMPQFSDLSDAELHSIARYIHYARQEGRYKELVDAQLPHGDASAGQTYFRSHCASCHSNDLDGIGKREDAATLLRDLLMPKKLVGPSSFTLASLADTQTAAGRQVHNKLLENFAPADVAGLVAYLATR